MKYRGEPEKPGEVTRLSPEESRMFEEINLSIDNAMIAAKVPVNAQNVRIQRDAGGNLSIRYTTTFHLQAPAR